MKRAALALVLLRCALAQQELPVGQDQAGLLAESIARAPLDEAKKQALRQGIRSRQFAAGEQMLIEEIDKNQKSPELLILAARLFMLDHNPVNAAIAFAKAEKLAPLAPADRYSLALAYIGLGKGGWARPELDRLAAAEPDNWRYQYWLARLDYDGREYESAVRRFKKVTAANPGFLRAWDNLGLSYEGTGQLDEAVESYRRANELNRKQAPPSPWPPLNMGILLTKMDQLKEADELLREAVRYDAKLAAAHYRLGVNLHKLDRKDEALRELTRATELAPEDPEPYYILGQIYRSQGKVEEADKAYDKFRVLKKKRRGE